MRRLFFVVGVLFISITGYSQCRVGGCTRSPLLFYMDASGGYDLAITNPDSLRTNHFVGGATIGLTMSDFLTLGVNYTGDGKSNELGGIVEFLPFRSRIDMPIRLRLYYDLTQKSYGAGFSLGVTYHVTNIFSIWIRDEIRGSYLSNYNWMNNAQIGLSLYL